MAAISGPNLPVSGLVLALDAANVRSYPALQDANASSISLMLDFEGVNNSTTFTDKSLNNLSISVTGNSIISTSQSKFGSSSLFVDGNGDYLTASNSSLFNFGAGDFTVECWIYATSLTGNPGTIFTTAYPTDSQGIYIGLLSNGYMNYLAGNGTWAFNSTTSSNPISINTWYHVAYVRSGNVFTVYINGVASGSTTNSITTTNSNNICYIGGRPLYSQYFTGYIDDLRVTKGVARYTANFTPPIGPLPLPNTFIDFTINKNNQTLTNSPTYSTSNQGIFTFNGTSSYSIGARPSGLVNGGQITISIWAKWTSVGTSTSNIQALVDNNHSSPSQGFIIQDRPDLGKVLTFGVLRSVNGVSSTFIVGDGTWHHIVCTNDGSTSTIYIDGRYNNAAAEVGGLVGLQPNVTIGRWQGGTRYLNGSVSNVLFYNRALTADEVAQLYHAEKGRFGL